MKRFYIFFAILIALGCWLPAVSDAQNVDLPDVHLAAAVRRALNIDPGDPILQTNLATLTQLDVSNYFQISDLTGLEHATALIELNLERNILINDISPLSGLTSLVSLNLNSVDISDISALSGLTSLEHLDLGGNNISDISALSGLTSLEHLDLHYNQGLSDIGALSGLTSLVSLNLSNSNISNISALSDLTSLERLYLFNLFFGNISDISALSDLKSLEVLDLRVNSITNVSALQGLTSLRLLWLMGNQELRDFQPLQPLRTAVEDQGVMVIDDLLNADVSGYPQAVQNAEDAADTYMSRMSGYVMIEPVDGYLLIDRKIGDEVPGAVGAGNASATITLSGHTDAVNAIAFSPDGTKLASASSDKTVRLWNPSTGALLHTLAGYHQSAVTSVAFSPDGTMLVSGDRSNRLHFWNVSTGGKAQTFKKFVHTVEDISWSSHGLASAGNLTVRIWNPTAKEKPTILRGHEAVVTALAWSPDGTTLVSGDRDDGTLRFWNPTTAQLVQTRQRFVHAVEDISWSSHGLASAGDLTVRLWNPTQDIKPTIFRGHTNIVYSVAWHPDGGMLASGSADSRVILWDTDGNILATRAEHTGAVRAVAWSPDGQLIASAGAGGSVLVWPVSAVIGAAPAASIFTPPIAPTEAALHPNYPNPFNPETWIPYQLASPAEVSLSIYAANGHRVRTLQLGHQPAGAYLSRGRAVYWDGRNTQGEPVASGVYFYTLKAGDFTATRKMLILK